VDAYFFLHSELWVSQSLKAQDQATAQLPAYRYRYVRTTDARILKRCLNFKHETLCTAIHRNDTNMVFDYHVHS
jgi:hypothetical protein